MEQKFNDTIALEGMHFYAYHGYYEEERKRGNNFSVDLYVHVDLKPGGAEDDLEKTVNYELLYALVEKVMQGNYKLLEHIALRILADVETGFDTIQAARVKVSKLNPPIRGDIKSVSVELTRTFR